MIGQKLAPLVITLAAIAFLPSSALATTATQTVTGTTLETIAITATPVTAFGTSFAPGATPSASGSLILTDTNPTWALTAQDTSIGVPGHLAAAAAGCSGSEAHLVNPLSISVESNLSGVTLNGAVSLSGSPQTLASSSSRALAADTFSTNYSQPIGSGETLRSGCVYTLTVTYTLQ
jgi:hypothetical protein